MRYVYLGGSMQNNSQRHVWRDAAKQMLPKGWQAIDPCDYEHMATAPPQELVDHDYRLIDQCHASLVRVTIPSWGTAIELPYTKARGIPIIGWSLTKPDSPWLIAHLTVHFVTLNEAVIHLGTL